MYIPFALTMFAPFSMASGKSTFANLHFEGLHLQDWHEIDMLCEDHG
jgi:hypothetical protein